jgi:FkbM family methyltransferase
MLPYALDKKPEYFFLPLQLVRRWVRTVRPPRDTDCLIVELPWGIPIAVSMNEGIGKAIWKGGVYELAMVETIWRLLDEGETFFDVGANIGYVSGLMACAVGPAGKGHAFEPLPQMKDRFERNLARWRDRGVQTPILFHPIALSNGQGEATLFLLEDFHANEGLASLLPPQGGSEGAVRVPTERLIDRLPPSEIGPVGLMKIDVEGAEELVFEGAGEWLSERRIRDVVFEMSEENPQPSMFFLEQQGYHLFRLAKSFWGPRLLDPQSMEPRLTWEPTNYLATTDPQRAVARLRKRGWSCLRARFRKHAG